MSTLRVPCIYILFSKTDLLVSFFYAILVQYQFKGPSLSMYLIKQWSLEIDNYLYPQNLTGSLSTAAQKMQLASNNVL